MHESTHQKGLSHPMSEPLTKDALRAEIQQARADFAALWHGLTPQQMSARPAVQADWSVKDLIAHITAWEEWLIDVLTAIRHNQPTNAFDAVRSEEAMDATNAQTFNANKDRPLEDILAAFAAQEARVLAAIDLFSMDELHTAPHPVPAGETLFTNITVSTYEHYEEHTPSLKHYIAQITDA